MMHLPLGVLQTPGATNLTYNVLKLMALGQNQANESQDVGNVIQIKYNPFAQEFFS